MSTTLLVSGDVQRRLELFAGYATMNAKISPENFVSKRLRVLVEVKQTYEFNLFACRMRFLNKHLELVRVIERSLPQPQSLE